MRKEGKNSIVQLVSQEWILFQRIQLNQFRKFRLDPTIKQIYYYYDVVLTFILRNNIQIQFEYKKVYKNKNNFFLLKKNTTFKPNNIIF